MAKKKPEPPKEPEGFTPPKPPSNLPNSACKIWIESVGDLVTEDDGKKRSLQASDLHLFASYCFYMGRAIELQTDTYGQETLDGRSGPKINPKITVAARYISLSVSLANTLGIGCILRNKAKRSQDLVNGEPPSQGQFRTGKKRNELNDFLAGTEDEDQDQDDA